MKTIIRILLAAAALAGAASAQCVWQNFYLVGSPCYANIAAALAAAGSTGWVMIPKTYTGTDSYVAGVYKNVIDQRGPFLGVYQWIAPSRPITGYPLGNDLALEADGPADLLLQHDVLDQVATTTSTAITAATAQNITLAAAVAAKVSTNADVQVERWTANEDFCTVNSIVSASVLNVTCPLAHSGTVSVEQLGNTAFGGGYGWYLAPSCPSTISAFHCPLRVGGAYANILAIPQTPSDPFPYNALQISVPITGMSGGRAPTAANELWLRNASSANAIHLQQSDGVDALTIYDTYISPVVPIYPSSAGNLSLGSFLKPWSTIYVGASGSGSAEIASDATSNVLMEMPNAYSQTAIAASVVTTAAASDTFTVQGLTGSAKCSLSASNTNAATNIAGTFIGSTGTNSVTLSHAAVANMVYALVCTAK